MAGIDDSGAIIGDWMPPSPSPRAFFSALLSDSSGLRSNPASSVENRSDGFFLGTQGNAGLETGKKDTAQASIPSDQVTEFNSFSQQRNSRGGLLERMAARAGFNAPRLNTESIKSSDLSSNPSPYLTIPPGLSPTTLLESPVFLSNSLAQPSPTTGKFPFVSNSNSKASTLIPETCDKNKDNFFDDIESSSFAFKPSAESGSLFLDQLGKSNPFGLSQQSFSSTEVLARSDKPLRTQIPQPARDISRSSTEKDNGVNNIATDRRVLGGAGGCAENSPPLEEQKDGGDQKGSGDSAIVTGGSGAPSEDGYNWRKYGQKQVKGSEYPRSYYKCTHPHCQVKKKVERSHEGHITEIIYKGEHNHPQPPPNRRSTIGSLNPLDMQVEFPEQNGQHSGVDGDLTWENLQKENASGAPDMGNDNIEVTSSASAGPDFCNRTPSLQPHNGSHLASGDAVDASSTFSNNEDEDDRGTHGSVSLAYDGEGEESESKRRKVEAYPTDVSGATRAVREPRVVVQTISEVDILDDGYRWRKYGQKVVKGNPNPRSYYKCTSPGCNVRKHVERASHDLKSVITTYEGKHNHDVPAARNSSHVNSSAAVQMSQAAAVQSQVHRSEVSQVHNSMARFERPPLNPFMLPGRPQLGPSPGFPYGINQPGLANMAKAGFSPGQGKMPFMPPFHPLLAQRPMNDMGFMLPKKEPKAETMPEHIHQFPNISGMEGQAAPWTSNVN